MCLSRTASEQRLAEQAKARIQTPMVPKTPLQAEVPREEPKRRPIPPPPKADLVEILSAEPEPEEVSGDSPLNRVGRTAPANALPRPSLITVEPQSSASISGGSSSPKAGATGPLLIDTSLAATLPAQVDDTARLQWREFGLIYVAYMGFLLSRKNYGFWLRSVISELGHEKGNAGLLGSTLEVTYGACSFLNGVVLDSRSPKNMLIAGLVLSAALNLSVASTDSLPLMIFLWGLNGAVQSVGWPSVTNIFLAWFPDPSSRGAWYSLLSTCQNAGAALVPLLVSASVSSYGWRAALYAPAVASTGVALLLAALLYGSPDAVAAHRDGGMSTHIQKAKAKPADLAHTMREQVFMNPKLWLMAVSYFGCSMVRTCLQVRDVLPLGALCAPPELGLAASPSGRLFQASAGPSPLLAPLPTVLLSPPSPSRSHRPRLLPASFLPRPFRRIGLRST
jgi:MFS family permease